MQKEFSMSLIDNF